jgi:hypothetical protein
MNLDIVVLIFLTILAVIMGAILMWFLWGLAQYISDNDYPGKEW